MNKFITLFFLLLSLNIAAQTGKITGKIVSSKTGDPLIGASVSIDTINKTVASDLNGVYTLSGLTAGTYSVSVSYVSYSKKIVSDVIVVADQVTLLTIALDEPLASNTQEVIVRTRVNRENIGALLATQKNSASMSDGISAEIIRRTPDRNTSDVLKRVSGASIQDDRFAIIRGLNDRYNAAFLNGAPLPSSESDRKAFAFNIFPSNILDNLVIFKTFTPDMSGEFAGGLINITTRSIPSENFTTLSVSGGYNTVTTFKEKYDYKGGKWDFLGFDDGKRALPDAVASRPTLNGLTPAERGTLAKTFSNNWALDKGKFAPNYGLQFTKGLNISRKGNDYIGMLYSLTYNRVSGFQEGERQAYEYDSFSPSGAPILRSNYFDKVYFDQTLVGALANFSLKINNKSTISLKNILSISGDDRVIRREGPPDASGDATFITRLSGRWFTSNVIFSSQLSGDHILNKSNLRLNWLGSYASVNRSIPDLRQSVYYGTLGSDNYISDAAGTNSLVPESGGTSFYSKTNENILSGKVDVTQPFSFLGIRQNQLKAGVYYQNRDRDFNARLLGFGVANSGNFDYSLLQLPEDKIYAPENMGTLSNGKNGFALLELNRPSYIYNASSKLFSGYAMLDQRFGKALRAIYGVRLENFNQKLDSHDDNNNPININTTKLDALPSASLIYSLNAKQNIRASYAKTLNRPEFRELAPFVFYDFVTRYNVEGDTNLVRATINNYDLRYEFYPGRAQLFSISGFYKDFTNPIELVTSPAIGTLQAKYQNAQTAKVYGVELEVRSLLSTVFGSSEKSIFNKITFSANTSFLKSEIKIAPQPGVTDPKALIAKRSLQGQSPYVLNSSLNYADEQKGLSATVSANRVGQRIYIVGTVSDVDIYENGRTVIDFQVAKTLQKGKWELRATAKDLLAPKLLFYSDMDSNGKYDGSIDKIFSNYTAGSTISLSATYKF